MAWKIINIINDKEKRNREELVTVPYEKQGALK